MRFEVLLLHAAPAAAMTRYLLYERIWGYDFGGESNIIEVDVRDVRSKLEEGGVPGSIQTVRGVGYASGDEHGDLHPADVLVELALLAVSLVVLGVLLCCRGGHPAVIVRHPAHQPGRGGRLTDRRRERSVRREWHRRWKVALH